MGLFTIHNTIKTEPTTYEKLRSLLIERVVKDERLDAQYVMDELPGMEDFRAGGKFYNCGDLFVKVKHEIQQEIDMRRKLNKLKAEMETT